MGAHNISFNEEIKKKYLLDTSLIKCDVTTLHAG